jgi:hypothetical protein
MELKLKYFTSARFEAPLTTSYEQSRITNRVFLQAFCNIVTLLKNSTKSNA